MSPEEMMQSVDAQVRFCAKTWQRHIDCPFCGKRNTNKDEGLCCDLLADAVEVVLNAMKAEEQCEFAKRVLYHALEERQKPRIIQ